jgi:Smg protein
MFDIFVYLFENYVHADACPEADQLARKLAAAGFEDDEISEALEWLNGLRRVSMGIPTILAPRVDAVRIYAPEEEAHLDADCRGFITFLENAGALDAAMRELVIERALALTGFRLNVRRFKIIVLMIMWQRDQPLDALILDELLTGDDDEDSFILQ